MTLPLKCRRTLMLHNLRFYSYEFLDAMLVRTPVRHWNRRCSNPDTEIGGLVQVADECKIIGAGMW